MSSRAVVYCVWVCESVAYNAVERACVYVYACIVPHEILMYASSGERQKNLGDSDMRMWLYLPQSNKKKTPLAN